MPRYSLKSIEIEKERTSRQKKHLPEDVCPSCSWITEYCVPPPTALACGGRPVDVVSFQINTFLSYEQDANKLPNVGCDQDNCQTGPSCLTKNHRDIHRTINDWFTLLIQLSDVVDCWKHQRF